MLGNVYKREKVMGDTKITAVQKAYAPLLREKENLPGSCRVHVMVAILAKPYVKMNRPFFASFIKQHFNLCFAKAGPRRGQRHIFIMDNDPPQSSKIAKTAFESIEAALLKILV